MQVPVEIAFENLEPNEELRSEIMRAAEKLEKFSTRITSCRVTVEGPHGRHRHGDLFRIGLRVSLPQHRDVIVDRTHADRPDAEHPRVAIAEAFDAARRQIEDEVREMRGDIKIHTPPAHGRIARFFPGQDGGMIEAADGHEVYFHRNAVLEGRFDALAEGDEVRFVEEAGDKGPQASTVETIGKHHLL